jgi:hypothetical protein
MDVVIMNGPVAKAAEAGGVMPPLSVTTSSTAAASNAGITSSQHLAAAQSRNHKVVFSYFAEPTLDHESAAKQFTADIQLEMDAVAFPNFDPTRADYSPVFLVMTTDDEAIVGGGIGQDGVEEAQSLGRSLEADGTPVRWLTATVDCYRR